MKMKNKNLGVNAILNVIKQCLSVIFPLITYPYALRVLGAEGIGKVNYSSTIIRYFSLLAMLGVTNYAIREGAKLRDDKNELNVFINEVFSINLISTVFSYFLFFIIVFSVLKFSDYRLLMILQSISMILTTLGIDYINTIYEDYFLITIRSIVTHIVSLFLLFLLVHSPSDYYIYAMLSVITNGIICISNLFYCRKYVHISFTHKLNLKKHLKPLVTLFANTIAIYIYVSVDTTMLGWIKGDYTVGLYTASVNVYSILKNILSAIYVVAVPRLAYCIGNDDLDQYKKISTELFGYLILLLMPASVGVICLSKEIMMLMGGEEYIYATTSLRILGVSLVFAIFGGFITACINISLGREKITLLATIISAIINFGLNLFVIPKFSLNGAAVTTLLSEAFVFVFCFFMLPNLKDMFYYNKLFRCLFDSFLGIALIIGISIITSAFVKYYIIRMLLTIILSIPAYFFILYLVKDPYFYGLQKMLKQKFFKKKDT